MRLEFDRPVSVRVLILFFWWLCCTGAMFATLGALAILEIAGIV